MTARRHCLFVLAQSYGIDLRPMLLLLQALAAVPGLVVDVLVRIGWTLADAVLVPRVKIGMPIVGGGDKRSDDVTVTLPQVVEDIAICYTSPATTLVETSCVDDLHPVQPIPAAQEGKNTLDLATVSPGDDKGGRPPKSEETCSPIEQVSSKRTTRESYLRAILRADPLIQDLYRQDLVSQGAAVKMGPAMSAPEVKYDIVTLNQPALLAASDPLGSIDTTVVDNTTPARQKGSEGCGKLPHPSPPDRQSQPRSRKPATLAAQSLAHPAASRLTTADLVRLPVVQLRRLAAARGHRSRMMRRDELLAVLG